MVAPGGQEAPGDPRRVVPLVAVEVSTLLSGAANGITGVALPWLILDGTGSAAGAGVVAASAAVPLALSSFVAGALVDRTGRRVSAVGADLLSLVAVAAIPLLSAVGDLGLAAVAALAALGAVFDPAGFTAREAMLPTAARAAGLRLERANGLHEAIWGASLIIGPGLGALLVAAVGPGSTLWATVACFAVSALVVAAVRLPGTERPADDDPARPSLWADAREGLRFVRRDPMVLSVVVFAALLDGTYLPVEAVLLPVHFESLDQPERLGTVLVAMSGGWLAGSLVYGAIGHRLPRRAVFVCAALGTALAFLPMALLPPYPVVLASGALAGFLYGPVNPLVNLVLQVRTPERLRARVIGIITSVTYVAGPAGYLVTGVLVESVGLRPAFLVVVAAVVAGAASSLVLRPLRGLDTLDPTAVAAPIPDAVSHRPLPTPGSGPG